jgi:hypothetical protein
MYFQKKCVDRIYEFKKRNKTIVFCSHSLYDVRQFCDQALWLEKGVTRALGDSVYVTNEYASFQRAHIGSATDMVQEKFPLAPAVEQSPRRPLPRIRDARIYLPGSDQECYQITTGDSFEVRVWWENPAPEELPIHLGIAFLRGDMTLCAAAATHFSGIELRGREGCTVLEVPRVRLLAGQFLVPVVLLDGEGVHRYHEYLMPENLLVRAYTRDLGLFRLDFAWRQRDLPAPAPGGGSPASSVRQA